MVKEASLRTRSVTTCAYCGTLGQFQHDNLKDRVFGAPGTWSIRRCHRCYLAWADPQPILEDIGKLYTTYFTHEEAVARPDAQISSPKKRAIKRLASYLLPWRKKALLADGRYLAHLNPGRLLDVGCGTGNFLAGMAALGWEATGVEFDDGALRTARQHKGIMVYPGSVEEQGFSDNSFDAITLSNVIEHVPDPAATLAELKRILAPGGRLVLITPNINSLGHRIFGRCWRGLEPPRHLFLFNPLTLEGFAKRAGFRTEACFTVPGRGSNILETSKDLWDRKARPRQPHSLKSLYLLETMKTILGAGDGEFVVLLATT
jgi:2-polyprenyl-3-methyl-5-hydroxy-6-metoxy-1,4-benzoquinol methylase